MPEITVTHIALLAGALIVGMIIGWMIRGNRSVGEKGAINAGWQEQLEAQRNEHERLLEQNKSLMQQNSQYQASNKDSKMRASELSDALKETFERRDELQRQIKDIRSNLEVAMQQRNQLQSDIETRAAETDATSTALQRRDETIEKLNRELLGWQERVPPLIERFRVRNQEALQLEEALAAARERIDALESMMNSDDTRIEPVDPGALRDGLDASNDPIDSDGQTNEIEEPEPEYAEQADDSDSDAEELLAPEELEDLIEEEAENSDVDDLKQIKGVGPAIEKTLNEMGICRFSQIAAMSEYEIDRVANKLKGFRSRIYREDWIGQARDLHDQKVAS